MFHNLIKRKPKTEGNPENPKIPFTYGYERDPEAVILDLLHPDDLKHISESKQIELEGQVFIQLPAQDKVNANYKNLLNSLKIIADEFCPEEKIDIEVKTDEASAYQNKYIELCKKIKLKLGLAIQKYDLKTSILNPSLIRDCIVHYCYGNAGDAGTLLNKFLVAPEKAYLINLLISQGAILDGYAIVHAIGFELPLETISRICDQNPKHDAWNASKREYTFTRGVTYDHGVIYGANGVFYATFHSDQAVLAFALEKFADKINMAFEELNRIKESAKGFTLVFEGCTRNFSLQTCHEAPNKLLKAARHLPLDEQQVIACLLSNVAEQKCPDGWQKVYIEHINEPYLNPKGQNDMKLETKQESKSMFACSASKPKTPAFKKPYIDAKKKFIENIQQRIYEYFINVDVLRTFVREKNIPGYYNACREALYSDVFSETHEQFGVSTEYRAKLAARLAEMDNTFRCSSAPAKTM